MNYISFIHVGVCDISVIQSKNSLRKFIDVKRRMCESEQH